MGANLLSLLIWSGSITSHGIGPIVILYFLDVTHTHGLRLGGFFPRVPSVGSKTTACRIQHAKSRKSLKTRQSRHEVSILPWIIITCPLQTNLEWAPLNSATTYMLGASHSAEHEPDRDASGRIGTARAQGESQGWGRRRRLEEEAWLVVWSGH